MRQHGGNHPNAVVRTSRALWISNEESRRAGGAYLFADRAAATAYLEGPIIARLRDNPAVTDASVRLFDVIPGPSATTSGIRAA